MLALALGRDPPNNLLGASANPSEGPVNGKLIFRSGDFAV